MLISPNTLPKRLIEVDLPIREISAHARREKSIRHGHISTLHIWWARRPLAACRAVLCAALWPDPADEHCPQAFRDAAALALAAFAEQVRTNKDLGNLCANHWTRWVRTTPASLRAQDPAAWPDMRYALLDFIADFANWDASTVPAFLETARLLTQVAHLALADGSFQLSAAVKNTANSGQLKEESLDERVNQLQAALKDLPRPLVVDPFAGGGSIPLEALRVGADAFASDLNPVAVLLNKVVLEYIPKYGNAEITFKAPEGAEHAGQEVTLHGLAEAVRYWGNWIKQQAEKELAEFYPKDPDGATPIAYLWARTIKCEGPNCGTEVPLMRSLLLARKGERSIALRLVPNKKAKRADFEIIAKQKGKWVLQDHPETDVENPTFDGTVRHGSVTCPICGYTTPVDRVRAQLKIRKGGAKDARLFCVVIIRPGEQGRFYRLPNDCDINATKKAISELENIKSTSDQGISLIPDEKISLNEIRRISVPIYGMETWEDLFSPRQLLSIKVVTQNITKIHLNNPELELVLKTLLALAVNKLADLGNALCAWEPVAECPRHLLARQAIGMVWDFAEGVPIGDSSGSWVIQTDRMSYALNDIGENWRIGNVEKASATSHPLPNDAANAFVTDPPYYDAVPYAHLSDFFFVWLKRSLNKSYPTLFNTIVTPKDQEIVVDRPHSLSTSNKNVAFYERELTKAFAEGRRVLAPDGIGTVVFASKTTASWEAILQAIIEAGWVITGSWPIDTEMETRIAAQGQARLASSIHLVCRPRENQDGFVPDTIGDWRNVLQELPGRIHSWLPHLAQEGVVGADAIFACLGPALEIFSRYSRVEKASGEQVTLKEYLEVVWAEVARQALTMIFEGADATGFEEDSRLTAMWLWTLSVKDEGGRMKDESGEQRSLSTEDESDDESVKKVEGGGYVLEFDAARKIAQGLGAHLERLETLVEIKGDKARLRSVSERAHALFGKQEDEVLGKRKKKDTAQMSLFSVMDEVEAQEAGLAERYTPTAGATSLDQLHQAMLLFATGRSESLKRFLVEDGVGKDQSFWRLAQALSALYPSGSDEKRWVDGVLARKKGLGF